MHLLTYFTTIKIYSHRQGLDPEKPPKTYDEI